MEYKKSQSIQQRETSHNQQVGEKAIQLQDNRALTNVFQLAGDRPTFSGPARKLNLNGKYLLDGDSYDMAHRLSFHDIQGIVMSGDQTEINKLIQALTIPQRDFGSDAQGDTSYYDKVKGITNQEDLIKALNNSPFNLRPGNSSVNRSIGAGFDGNIDDDGYETDQSEALRPFAKTFDPQGRTSSYLSDKELQKWENAAYKNLGF